MSDGSELHQQTLILQQMLAVLRSIDRRLMSHDERAIADAEAARTKEAATRGHSPDAINIPSQVTPFR